MLTLIRCHTHPVLTAILSIISSGGTLRPDPPRGRLGMSFDELLRRVRRRVEDCQRSGRGDDIVSDSAATDAIGLWQAAKPPDPERPTPEDDQRLAVARHALGWLSHLRWTAQPTPDNIHAF